VNDFCELNKEVIAAETLADIKQSGWELFINKAHKRYKLPRSLVNYLAKKFVTI